MATKQPDPIEEALARSRVRRRLPPADVRRILRQRSGLSQSEVARLLGVLQATVARYEAGTRTPRGAIAERYLELLDRLAQEAAR